MIDKLADRLINVQRQSGNISEVDEKIYKYGYILLFELLINITSAIAIGIISGKLGETAFFLCMYIPLRSFSGGWHADSIWKCTIVSNMILLFQVILLGVGAAGIHLFFTLLMCFAGMLYVSRKSPIDTVNKRISSQEAKNYKRVINIIILIHIAIISGLIHFGLKNLIFCATFVYVVQSTMLLLEMLKNKLRYKK